MVDMAMQQVAAAPARFMTQRPELKFVNEPGEETLDGGREIFVGSYD